MDFDEVVRKRRSIRRYKDKEVPQEMIDNIMKSAFYSPSASNKRPWHFVVVEDEEKKKALAETHKYAGMAATAPVVIVVCADEEEASHWIEDASIATEHMHLKATDLGLGSCWIQVRGEEEREEHVGNVLNIPEGIRVLCLLSLGYPGEEKREHSVEEVMEDRIHREDFEG